MKEKRKKAVGKGYGNGRYSAGRGNQQIGLDFGFSDLRGGDSENKRQGKE